MATLLIGGNGLVGTRLVQHLVNMGEQVISYSAHPPRVPVEGVIYIQGDVTEYGTINQVLNRYKVDRIIHNTAVSHPKLFLDNPYKIYRINVVGTLTALEAARNYNISRFIYISSGAVYGNVHLDLVSENVPIHGESPYGASKVACEELVRNYGLDSASLRVGFVYGPGRKFECPIHMILDDCIHKKEVRWEHGIDQVMDYIYIDDCVDAIATIALAQQLPHREYNIGGGENVPYSRVINCVQKLYPDTPIQIGPGDLGYDNLGALDMSRSLNDFNWKPHVTIEEGIQRYNQWLIKNS